MFGKENVGRLIKNGIVTTSDETLKSNLKHTLSTVENYELLVDKKEMSSFRTAFYTIETSIYKSMYKVIDSILETNYDLLEDNLKLADLILDTGIFKPERVSPTKVEIHNYQMRDIAKFTTALNSKRRHYSTAYITTLDKLSKDEYMILREGIDKNDEQVVDLILSPYRNWYKQLEAFRHNNVINTIYNHLQENEQEALSLSRKRLLYYITKLSQEEESEINDYTNAIKSRSCEYVVRARQRGKGLL